MVGTQISALRGMDCMDKLGHQRLAGPCGQHDHPLPPCLHPGGQGLLLVHVGRDLAGDLEFQFLEAGRLVLVADQLVAQQFADLAVRLPWSAVRLGAGVPGEQWATTSGTSRRTIVPRSCLRTCAMRSA